jgi:hypothetical protein
MRVIGAGFGRTGTASLRAALEELGLGPCYHMTEVFRNPHHIELWEEAYEGRLGSWGEILGGYRSAVDWPVAAFWQELAREYPEAKVVLTVRDPEEWYESTRRTIYRISEVSSSPLFTVLGLFAPGPRRQARMASRIVWKGTFGGRFEDRDYAIGLYERHNAEVKASFRPERLLVYDVKDGWEPLCGFLGVEVPDKPFPHLNETASFRRMVLRRMARAAGRACAAAALAGLAAVLLLRAGRRHRG